MRGTSIDKILKRKEVKHSPVQAQKITIDLISQKPPDLEAPDIVEGEVVKDNDDDGGALV